MPGHPRLLLGNRRETWMPGIRPGMSKVGVSMRSAVLGGGNGSLAAAGDFALQGHEVRLWRRDKASIAAHQEIGSSVIVKDHSGKRDGKLTLVTADNANSGENARFGLCPTPPFAQPLISKPPA